MRRSWTWGSVLGALLVTSGAWAAEKPIPLQPGVLLNYVHHNFDSPEDRQIFVEVEAVTPEAVTFAQDLRRAGADGGAVKRYRQVMTRPEMLRSKTLAFGWGCAGQEVEQEATQGSSRFMASQRLLRLLKEQDDTDIASYYVNGCSPPRLISGSVRRAGGAETFPILINGQTKELPAVHVRGQMAKALEGIDWFFDWWFLDDPEQPWLLAVNGEEKGTKRTYRYQMAMAQVPDPTSKTSLEQALQGDCEATVYGITFATGSAEITGASRGTLDDVAAVLRKHPDWKLTIQGHTDNIGDEKSNQALSERRAQAVREALVKGRGIPASALETKGFGLTKPVASNATIEGRARNRRVQLVRGCRG
ncbi:MAG TPA: OmpA family protein [Myxococcaceae bacterium]|nr:OmpA family protein [Myxococcaceae bacterium]